MSIKCLLGFHDIDTTERTFIGTEKVYENAGRMITSDTLYKFTTKGKCFRCGKHFKGRQKMRWFDLTKQPYDTNFTDIEGYK